LLFLAAGILSAAAPPKNFGEPLNPGKQTFDTQTTSLQLPDGSSWTIWKTYHKSQERVLVRHFPAADPKSAGLAVNLSGKPSIVDAPVLVADSTGRSLWAFWSARRDGHWRIEGRAHAAGKWGAIKTLSPAESDAIKPNAVVLKSGAVTIAWHEFAAGRNAQVRLRHFADGTWGEPQTISRASTDSFRPALAELDGQVWAFWDEYAAGEYAVATRAILPTLGDIETISPKGPAGQRCIKPAPIFSKEHGLCVVWLRLVDVIGGEGVIDMIHTAHASVRKDGKWVPVRDAKDNDEGAAMLNGLLPDLRPDKGYPSGYIGKRRHPMLLEADDSMWLIWERKTVHGGSGTKTTGQLLGRPFANGAWGEAVQLFHGLIDYNLVRPARAKDNQFDVTGSEIPRAWIRPYHQTTIDLKETQPFAPDDWRSQFKPIDLVGGFQPPRHGIEVDGKKYQLYWADLHCHSGLTGDAEGEPDEIVLYARDRARLDVMVMQDNDDVHGCLLTEGEYYMGMLHSQNYTENGRFIALPGYEWTQRKGRPGKAFDPWKSVYLQPSGNSYPNHRTVIYPPSGGPIIRYTEVGGDFAKLTAAAQKFGGILNGQHRTFDIVDHPAEANMEVTSCWGIYIHDVPQKFHGELDAGKKLGFVGCSDSHRRNPGLCGGLTGIWAEELTGEAVLRALREHRCFASNGSKIIVDSRLERKLTDTRHVTKRTRLTFDLHVRGTREVVSATLMSDRGKAIRTYAGNGTQDLKLKHIQRDVAKGDHWYYWEIRQAGNSKQYRGNISVAQGHLAWSSPHFITVE
jgi:hypothetical protein